MTVRPRAMLAMDPQVVHDVFPADVLDRLEVVAELPDRRAVTRFGAATRDTEVLLTSWGCPVLDEPRLNSMPRLRAVIHAAGSVKRHVTPAVFERGIQVSSGAAVNAQPVAEFTVAMMVLGAKQTFLRAAAYAQGESAPGYVPNEDSGFYGVTVGVIGASQIGRRVIARLSGYHVNIVVTDPYLTPSDARGLGAELCELDELCARSDLVSVHAPALPETRHLLGARQFSTMRDGAVVINTARGTLIDTDALTKECATGRLSAALDVTDPEPLPTGHPLFAMPNVLITPHLAGARGRERRRLGEMAVGEVERFVGGEDMLGLVDGADLARIA